jgi:sugar lactone lactonase YvrE
LTALVRIRTVHVMNARSSSCQIFIATINLALLSACQATPSIRSGPFGSGSAFADASDLSDGSVSHSGAIDAGLSDTGAHDGGVIVTTVAGNDGFHDGTGGPNGTAEFTEPSAVAVDAQGNVYVADTANNRVRKIDSSGNVTTLAGNGTPGYADGTGGPTGTAEFNAPDGVALDTQGNVYVADGSNNRIREINVSGSVTTLAGNGASGFADGTGGPTGTAEFNGPAAIAIDSHGNAYVGDSGNSRIRKIDSVGQVTTLAGNGKQGYAPGAGRTAEFNNIGGIAVDAHGTVYVGDTGNNIVRTIDVGGDVTTLAGNLMPGDADGSGGPNGFAQFHFPCGLAVDAEGNIYVADALNHAIRKIDASGNVMTLAGPAGFNTPTAVALDAQGNIYVADSGSHRIRKIEVSGAVTSLAGNGGNSYTGGWSDGTGGPNGAAQFSSPQGVAVDAQGNIYIGDTYNNRIRKIDVSGNVTTLAGNGAGAPAQGGFLDGTGGPNGTAELFHPSGIAVDTQGTVCFADSLNASIRKIDPSGKVTTFAGSGTSGFADGLAGEAEFAWPRGVAVDVNGAVYVADLANNRIRKIDPLGTVTTLAGNGAGAGRGDWTYPAGAYFNDGTGGPNGTAEFAEPCGVAVDSLGNVYVADSANNRIRKIDAAGNVTTLAGNGNKGWMDGTGGPGGTAEFRYPTGVAVDLRGNVYVGDLGNERIRTIDIMGNVTTLAGNGTQGWMDGAGGPNGPAEFILPWAVAVDARDNLYVAEWGGNRIRRIEQ